jgi:hypothetical protein
VITNAGKYLVLVAVIRRAYQRIGNYGALSNTAAL